MSTVVKDLGAATAYGYAVEKGYTGTEAEFAELMASYATVGQTAVTAAQTATTKASEAATSATTATTKASEATTAATTATTKAAEAQADADAAALDASQALSAASTATTKATEATTAAATATSAATTATTAKDDAVSAKTAAQTAQTGAETAAASVQSSAEQIATNAEDISQLKSEITDKSDTADMLKAFPTDTANGAIVSFADGANVPLKSLIVNIDPVQSGSGDPSPDNVRPISGWSEVNVQRPGKNLLDDSNIRDISDWESLGDNRYQKIFNIKKGVTYTISGHHTVPSGDPYVYLQQRINDEWVMIKEFWQATNNFLPWTFTPTSDELRLWAYNYDVSIKTIDWMQIELGSTATPYEPYSGQSINIPLGQTVYGGKLDVTNGELVIDRAGVDMGTLDYVQGASTVSFNASLPNDKKIFGNHELANWICTKYPIVIGNNFSDATIGIASINLGRMYIKDPAFNGLTASQVKTALSGVYLVYELATPITVQLTPHEVTALLGSNNVWADTGDSTVEYRADPTLYIGRLTEPDADMVADANITSGQYFMVGNTLYKATANIASGATISPNVNCTRKSLSEALNELNV